MDFLEVKEQKQKLLLHPLFKHLVNLQDYQIFMKHHVFAVWDFMNLLKTLQRQLTGVQVPWLPVGDPLSRRLINEIVLEEESDEVEPGLYLSHYEMYRQAMMALGADETWIAAWEEGLRLGQDVTKLLADSPLPCSIQDFLSTHWEILQGQDIVQVAASFTLGREDLIPEMFPLFLENLSQKKNTSFRGLIQYLDRHILLDGENHRPLALQLLQQLIGGDLKKYQRAVQAATQSLIARSRLWDGVLDEIKELASQELSQQLPEEKIRAY